MLVIKFIIFLEVMMNKCFKLVGTAVLGIGLFIGMQNSVEATPSKGVQKLCLHMGIINYL